LAIADETLGIISNKQDNGYNKDFTIFSMNATEISKRTLLKKEHKFKYQPSRFSVQEIQKYLSQPNSDLQEVQNSKPEQYKSSIGL
jgi:hypothetical protein